MNKPIDDILRAKLNLETATMQWKELERFFASGVLILVGSDLDLVDVGVCVANDEKAAVAKWLEDGRIAKVSNEQAIAWHEANATLWTVVIKPWILVQEEKRIAH